MLSVLNDDDWFYDSIRRYKTLQMYDLRMEPYFMAKYDDDSLCLAGAHPENGRWEMLRIELPAKLLLPEEEGNRCKGNDFNIKSGCFIKDHIRAMGVLPSGKKTVLSIKGKTGLRLMDLVPSNTHVDGVVLLEKNPYAVVSPNFSINPSASELLASKSAWDPVIRLDCNTDSKTVIQLPQQLGSLVDGEILSCYCSTDVVALLNTGTGTVVTLDIRTGNEVAEYKSNELKVGHFVMAAHKDHGVATLCSDGSVCLYDRRNPCNIIAGHKVLLPSYDDMRLKIQMASGNRVSISGFDSSVRIYQLLGNELVEIFTHCGHSRLDALPGRTVSDHLWLPHLAENLLVSCALNGSVNCWDYVRM